MGRKVLDKTVSESYKTKNHRKIAPEEQFVFDGAVPAIVDEETWNNAQQLAQDCSPLSLRETRRPSPTPSRAARLL